MEREVDGFACRDRVCAVTEEETGFADIQSAGEKRTDGASLQDGVAGAAGIAAAARGLHARVYADA